MKRKISQKRSARTMRSSVAYSRLAAKAYREGDMRAWVRFSDKAAFMREKAEREREREETRR